MDQNQLNAVFDIIRVLAMAGFGGGVMSLFVSLVVDAPWDKRAKDTVAVLSCIIVSLLGLIVANIDLTNMVIVAPAMILGCHFSYVKFWKPTGIGLWIEQFFSTAPRN